MGRRPDPIPLKILKGIRPGKDQEGYDIPDPPPFDRGAPAAPDWLSPYAREMWDRTVPNLEVIDLLKPDDYGILVAYCETWSTYREALEIVRREGIIRTNEKTGMSHKHPALLTLDVSGPQLLRYAIEFGLTPAAEVRLARPRKADDKDDPFATPVTGTDQ